MPKTDRAFELDWPAHIAAEMAKVRREQEKPLMIVTPPLEQDKQEFITKRQTLVQKLRQNGIPVFPPSTAPPK